MDLLQKILQHKKEEVRMSEARMSKSMLESSPFFTRDPYSLKEKLENVSSPRIIAEFKRKSPSRGVINQHADVFQVATAYKQAGAAGMSVLTDGEFFAGSPGDVCVARKVELPILRKDFIISEYQILEARALGADVILLIAAALEPYEVQLYTDLAHSLGLEVILEIHGEEELEKVTDSVDIIGVNNRDLRVFETNVNISRDLAPALAGRVTISESGLKDAETIRELFELGYAGFLIGETFMKTSDPGAACKTLIENLR